MFTQSVLQQYGDSIFQLFKGKILKTYFLFLKRYGKNIAYFNKTA